MARNISHRCHSQNSRSPACLPAQANRPFYPVNDTAISIIDRSAAPTPSRLPDRFPTRARGRSGVYGKERVLLCRECRAKHQLLRHFLLSEIDEVLAAALRRQHVLEVELLQLGHHLAQIVVGRPGQVKTAGLRIDFSDAADFLRAPQRIDDAGVTAGAD